MQEWTIKVEVKPPDECLVDGEPTSGYVTWASENAKLSAEITLSETAGEDTLVHELLHIVIEGHKPYEKYDSQTERAINRIAAVICNQS